VRADTKTLGRNGIFLGGPMRGGSALNTVKGNRMSGVTTVGWGGKLYELGNRREQLGREGLPRFPTSYCHLRQRLSSASGTGELKEILKRCVKGEDIVPYGTA